MGNFFKPLPPISPQKIPQPPKKTAHVQWNASHNVGKLLEQYEVPIRSIRGDM